MSEFLSSMRAAWKNSQLSGSNTAYLEGIYEDYLQDPSSIEPTWRAYFDQLVQENKGPKDVSHEAIREALIEMTTTGADLTLNSANSSANNSGVSEANKWVGVENLINAYRLLGHRRANLDPLKLKALPEISELSLAYHGLSAEDLDKKFIYLGLNLKLKEIIQALEQTYCQTMGIEYMHMISHSEEKNWIQSQIENKKLDLNKDQKIALLQDLIAADGLEKYLGMKYVGQKRFSLEGGDNLIPMVNGLIHQACQQGIREVVMGMAHRGRLNVLVNVLGKSPEDLMAEFEGKQSQTLVSGDVKYHNGFSSEIKTPYGVIHAAMAFNPSHLEIVSPVVSGSARARQDRRYQDRSEVLPIVMHGDAAFSGQGVVMEHLNLSLLRGFYIGGSIHIVINNQVGFTTSNPLDARSSTYCTDIAKMIEAPVFHVNGDDAEAVLWVAQLALNYRMKFKKDVVIDLVCYRLHGHNESDEPFGTQPLMYQAIKKHEVAYKIYAEKLISEGLVNKSEIDQQVSVYKAKLEAGKSIINLAEKDKKTLNFAPYLGATWDMVYSTGIKKNKLYEIAKKLEKLPENFVLQKQVAKALEDRVQMTEGQLAINWGYAEILAYASLLEEGTSVRLVGQDAGRGTFSHRHAVLHDQNTDDVYIPLKNLLANQIKVDIIDSTLSEEAVLAFEYGYASSAPNALVLWEAQFGDFANGAQVVIDQFISSAEEKWGRLCGLVLLLPHGQEGMGAEHSSARLERFLQLCANENMQVCVPTTPAQMYHMLRRQRVRPYRKPLIVMTPKSLLRHPLVTSSLDDLATGKFHCVMDEIDQLNNPEIKKLIICQGKVFYDLLTRRREEKIKNIAIIRLEQLYPFPEAEFKEILKKYSFVDQIVWCQEEPVNQGAWYIIQHSIRECLHALNQKQILSYAGRGAFASPAVGYASLYKTQQEQLILDALKI